MSEEKLQAKLQALVAELKPLLEKATPRPWSTNSRFRPSSSAKVLVGSDLRSIAYVGMNPQSKDWEIHAQDITNATLIVAVVNAVSQLEALLAERQPTVPAELSAIISKLEADSFSWDDKNEESLIPPSPPSSDYIYGYNAGVSEGLRAAASRLNTLCAAAPSSGTGGRK